MKKLSMTSYVIFLQLSLSFTLTACGETQGVTYGNVTEKMAIFSLIALTVFAIILVSFSESRRKSINVAGKIDLVQLDSKISLVPSDLIEYPVYVREFRYSFYKIVFLPDGVVLKSSSVLINELDPTVTTAGVWELTSEDKIKIKLDYLGKIRMFTCIFKDSSTMLMQPDFGLVEVWYFGSCSLANIQIAIFGYSASTPAEMKFTTEFISGKTIYWATYPLILVSASGDVVVNDEATYGMITFGENGVLSKSIANMIKSEPNYAPSFVGTWSVNNRSGVITMTVSGVTTTASILNQTSGDCELLVCTTVENRLWFYDPTDAPKKVAFYISEGCRLLELYTV